MSNSKLLSLLRMDMQKRSLNALVVFSADAHNSEYVADCFKYREQISGFKGSAATCVVTDSKALLWTDGRYWLEASKSLYPGWELMKDGMVGVPSFDDWLAKELPSGAKVGMDPFTITIGAWDRISKTVNAVPTEGNMVAALDARKCDGSVEGIPSEKVFAHDTKFSGATTKEKVKVIAQKLRDAQCQFTVVSALDDIAWLLNLRGKDVSYNPVFYAYAVVEATERVTLFTAKEKLTEVSLPDFVAVHPYTSLQDHIASMTHKDECPPLMCAVDEYQTSQGVHNVLQEANIGVKKTKGFVEYAKSVKNATELQGFRDCHVRDGVALTRYIFWLKQQMKQGTVTLDEVDVATKLQELREENEHFVQLSFPTISSVGANGAIIHYGPSKPTAAVMKKDELYLCDSGAQYFDGTTDVTRTLCFSAPKDREKEAYTLVLKGHIAINTAKFPAGVTGHRIDALARTALWNHGLDYQHGTGHGVGAFLNVHEGPQGIGARHNPKAAFLEQGMVVSNEPGFYLDGGFGIRIENLEYIVPAKTKYGDDKWSTFEQLTMAPLEPELIDKDLLTGAEVQWVNDYHQKVFDKLHPLLVEKDADAAAFLKVVTQPM